MFMRNYTSGLIIAAVVVGSQLITPARTQGGVIVVVGTPAAGTLSAVALAATEVSGNSCWYKWVIDPVGVTDFRLSFQFDPNVLDFYPQVDIGGVLQSGIQYINGYSEAEAPDYSMLNFGLIKNIRGFHPNPPDAEIDMFVVYTKFKDGIAPGTMTTATVFAGDGDYMVGRFNNQDYTISADSITSASDTAAMCPEPSSLITAALGAVGLLSYGRRRLS